MHLLHSLRPHIADGLAPVEHGRELQQQVVGLLQQLVEQRQHIGGAVADAIGAASMVVAAGGVEEDERHVLLQLVQVVDAIGAERGDALAQRGKVGTGYGAEVGLSLHVDGRVEEVAQESCVNAKASREVQTFAVFCELMGNASLIACRGLAAALLHREMPRIDDAIGGSPRGQLAARQLTALYLLQGQGHVYIFVLARVQSKLAHVGIGVRQHILPCGAIQQGASFHVGCKGPSSNVEH